MQCVKMSAAFSPEVLEERLRSLHELREFTESCRSQLTEVFKALDWSPDWDSQEQMKVCCFDANHRVPCRSMEKHKVTCQLAQLAYSREEQAEMYDSSICYERTNIPSIKLDKQEQHQVILQAQASAPTVPSSGIFCQSDYSTEPADVPQNYKRATCDLTVADRLALYDHIVLKAKQHCAQAQMSGNEDLYVDLVSKLNKDEEQNTPKSHLEVLAEMRDYRRRRQSYRAKNVHITKKSYTEVIREVIDVHSGELAKLWQEDREEESKTSQHFHRRPSDEGRSASVESRTSSREENGSRHKRHRKRSRDRSREKESKSSRKRDSHSPEERHHKKKKKKSKS